MAYPATPKTWVAGDVLTAAQLNAELRDALLAAFPLSVNAWTAFTPTLTQSATVTKTATYAKYQRVGRLIVAQVNLAVTGAGTAGQNVLVGTPVPAAAATLEVGVGLVYDSSTGGTFRAIAELDTVNTILFRGTTSTALDGLGSAGFVAALASGDVVRYSIAYEAAT